MRCGDIIEKLEILSPIPFAEEWDNVGLLAGRRDKKVERIFLAVDATDEVIEQAVAFQADMLITHHPLIFKGLKKISTDDFVGRRIFSLIQNDISYYAMHTNFDVMGMADAAADEIELKDRQVLDITYEDEISKEGCGRFGKLPQIMSLQECAKLVKEKFHLENVRVYGELDTMLETAAIMPGSGADMIGDALKARVDVMITGDIKHHEGIDAVARGLSIIDAGHYGIEKLFVPYIREYLARELGQVRIGEARQSNPFWTV